MKILLASSEYPAIATHDPSMHDLAIQWAAERGLGPDAFEFQLLYGVRRDLQASLVARGYRVRVYIPFGREWFPYFMRRLGERPANVTSVVGASSTSAPRGFASVGDGMSEARVSRHYRRIGRHRSRDRPPARARRRASPSARAAPTASTRSRPRLAPPAARR